MASPAKVAKGDEKDVMVKLNVGGYLYTTSLSTLIRYPDSMLGAMFSGELDPSVRDDNGAYVIDRDGPIFRHVLNFLRQGKLILPEDFKEWELLATEADFYDIKALADAVSEAKCQRVRPEDVKGKVELVEISFNIEYLLSYVYIGSSDTLAKLPKLYKLIRKGRQFIGYHEKGAQEEVQRNGMVKGTFNEYLSEECRNDIFKEMLAHGFEPRGAPLHIAKSKETQISTFIRKN